MGNWRSSCVSHSSRLLLTAACKYFYIQFIVSIYSRLILLCFFLFLFLFFLPRSYASSHFLPHASSTVFCSSVILYFIFLFSLIYSLFIASRVLTSVFFTSASCFLFSHFHLYLYFLFFFSFVLVLFASVPFTSSSHPSSIHPPSISHAFLQYITLAHPPRASTLVNPLHIISLLVCRPGLASSLFLTSWTLSWLSLLYFLFSLLSSSSSS